MLHLLSRMKKPALRHGRNHEKCTEERCNAFPADLHDYYSGHVSNGSDGEKCHCVDVVIKNEEVVVILEEDDCIPLLEIIPADSGDLMALQSELSNLLRKYLRRYISCISALINIQYQDLAVLILNIEYSIVLV
jgi:hypothetical protein